MTVIFPLLLACLPASLALRLALVRGPDRGHYDLAAVGKALQSSHTVVTWDLEDDGEGVGTALREARKRGQPFDAVLAQGPAATAIADFVERGRTPLVRFMAPKENLMLLYERPAVIVYPSQGDLDNFGEFMLESRKLVITSQQATSSSGLAELNKQLRALTKKVPGTDLLFWQQLNAAKNALILEGEGKDSEGRLYRGESILGVVMIVKNENGTIAQTLQSFKEEADYVTVVDTGSDDGTQAIILRELEGFKGQLVEHPFVDFSTTRNWALRAHGQKTPYVFMVDADFTATGVWRMRIACRRLLQECAERSLAECPKGIKMWLNIGASGFFTNRVFPTDDIGTEEGWRYTYPVHEVPGRPSIDYMNGAWIGDVLQYKHLQMHNIPITHNKSPTRWKNLDLPLLTKEHEKHPTDRRVMFYLAQTYDLIEDLPAALAMYQKRIDAGGWQQEVFEAHMRRGRIMHDRMEGVEGADPRPDFLAALKINPDRAEPLLWLCWEYHKKMDRCPPEDAVCSLQNRVAAYYYAKQAAEKPFPTGDTLFVNQPVYQYQAKEAVSIHAWHLINELGDAFEIGYPLALEVQAKYPNAWRKRNVELYESLPQFHAKAATRSTDHSEL